MLPKLCSGQTEIILNTGRDRHRDPACHPGKRVITDKAWFGNQHLFPFAGIDRSPDAQVDRLAPADGGKDIGFGVIGKGKTAFEIVADLCTQRDQARVCGVKGVPLLQALDPCTADLPRGFKIRLPNAKGDHIIHLRRDVEKSADTRWFEGGGRSAQQLIIIHHWEVTSRSSRGASAISRPRSLYFFRIKWVLVDCTASNGASRCATNRAISLNVLPLIVSARS